MLAECYTAVGMCLIVYAECLLHMHKKRNANGDVKAILTVE